ncbi:unnamed protein product [Calypogeia fissa]
MADDAEQQLQFVQTELNHVQDQMSALVELEKSLLEQRDELRILLEFRRQGTVQEANGSSAGVSRTTHTDWSGKFEWDESAADLRLNVFGISSYRTNQREIMNAVISGRDVVVIMAAGGGKSLCYQLPALLRPGIALVVSPLVSLIQDQVMGLTALDIPAGMLTSTTSKEEEKAIYSSLEKGDGDLRILYVTPEKIAKSKRFMSKLEKCNKAGRLSLMAIDEAHCCSQWGHDFRPDYKNLGILKTQFPMVPIIALTATATQKVQNDVKEMLHITYCEKFVSSINRPNLFYEIRQKQTNASGAIDDIAEFIKEEYTKKESGIVYCFSRRECEQVADELCKRKVSAAHYHAYMEPEEKSRVHNRWSSNKIQVIVGTVAFGMGINKPDVRFVIHHSISKSLETYYQESGRAGRDGLPAHCLLFFRPADLSRQSSMVFSEYSGLPNLYAMAEFCKSKKACRRAAFFRHFGEPAQDCSGMCDNCAYSRNVEDQDVTAHAKSLMKHLNELTSGEQKITVLQLVDSWKSRSRQSGPDSALMKELSKEDVERVIVQLLLDGILREEFQHTAYSTNAYITLGAIGRRFIDGQSQQKVVLEVVQPVNAKAKANSQSGATGAADSILQSGMAQVLDSLRQHLASSQGNSFPHSILSSQHIAMLCARGPDSLEEVEKVIGKRKTKQFGAAILEAIKEYIKQNPEESFEKTGPGVNSRIASTISSGANTPKSSKKPAQVGKMARVEISTGQIPESRLRGSDMVVDGCINLDTESEGEEEAQNGPEINTRKQESEDDDDDFVLVKRQVKRKR